MRMISALAAAFAAVVLAGCIPEFVNAPKGDGSAADPALIGTWAEPDRAGDRGEVTITAEGEGLKVTIATLEGATRTEDPNALLAKTVTVAGRTYVLVWNADATDQDRRYLIFRYAIDGETLTVEGLDSEKVKAAIAAAELSGSATESRIEVAGSAEEVAEFLASPQGQDAFVPTDPAETPALVLRRVK